MTHRKYLKAWIIFFLVATVGGGIAGGMVGGLLGGILGIAHVDLETIKRVGMIAGFIVGIPISYIVFYWVTSQFIVKPLMQASSVQAANQALVPTPASVTPAAGAPVAPDAGAAHL